jgi:CheY-like chemotaxis protein
VGKILAVMSDLFFSVKINDAAKRSGRTAEFVKDHALALEKAREQPHLIIIDLNCDAAGPMELIREIKADPATAGIPMVGFVSHVQVVLREQALKLGCDTVVARSVFDQGLAGQLDKLTDR